MRRGHAIVRRRPRDRRTLAWASAGGWLPGIRTRPSGLSYRISPTSVPAGVERDGTPREPDERERPSSLFVCGFVRWGARHVAGDFKTARSDASARQWLIPRRRSQPDAYFVSSAPGDRRAAGHSHPIPRERRSALPVRPSVNAGRLGHESARQVRSSFPLENVDIGNEKRQLSWEGRGRGRAYNGLITSVVTTGASRPSFVTASFRKSRLCSFGFANSIVTCIRIYIILYYI